MLPLGMLLILRHSLLLLLLQSAPLLGVFSMNYKRNYHEASHSFAFYFHFVISTPDEEG